MKLATSEEIRLIDKLAVEKFRIPEPELMNRAGTGAAKAILKEFPSLRQVVVVAGPGKNGGDGEVVAKRLVEKGILAHLLKTTDLTPHWKNLVSEADLIVDALFGVGLSRNLQGIEREIILCLNSSRKKVVSLDIPSGLSADTGRVLGEAVRADLTCTIGIPKVGLFIGEGPEFSGKIVTIDLGIPEAVYQKISGHLLHPRDFRSCIEPRRNDTHKGTYGHLLLIGGSVNRLGAPLMAARAALRTGAGLVTVGLPDRCYQKIPKELLEVMYEPLPSNKVGRLSLPALKEIQPLTKDKGVVAIGPGLGVTPDIRKIVEALIKSGSTPLLLDADALNALGKKGEIFRKSHKTIVLTPHPGEMGRLIGKTAAEVQTNRLESARELARGGRVYLVLKGFHTLVVTPEGDYFVNPTGNPGMATAGMGDVLTGMIAALMSQSSHSVLEALLAAVYLHGLAGDRLRTRLGDRGFLATDLIEEIPLAFRELTGC